MRTKENISNKEQNSLSSFFRAIIAVPLNRKKSSAAEFLSTSPRRLLTPSGKAYRLCPRGGGARGSNPALHSPAVYALL